MKGFLYKDIISAKVSFISIIILQLALTLSLCLAAFVTRGSTEDMNMITIIFLISYFLMFLLSTNLMTDFFAKDENHLWKYFALTIPDNVEGYVKSKYIVMILSQIFASASCVITDCICRAINPDMLDNTFVIFILLIINIIKISFQVPGIIYIGTQKGTVASNMIFVIIMFLGAVYLLFGDLSFFMDENFFAKLYELLLSGKLSWLIWVLALLPWISIFAFWLSYRVSVILYRKEVEKDE